MVQLDPIQHQVNSHLAQLKAKRRLIPSTKPVPPPEQANDNFFNLTPTQPTTIRLSIHKAQSRIRNLVSRTTPLPLDSTNTSTDSLADTTPPPSRTLTLNEHPLDPLARRESRFKPSPKYRTTTTRRDKSTNFQRILAKTRKKTQLQGNRVGQEEEEEEDVLSQALKEIGLEFDEKEKYVLETLIEHQRG